MVLQSDYSVFGLYFLVVEEEMEYLVVGEDCLMRNGLYLFERNSALMYFVPADKMGNVGNGSIVSIVFDGIAGFQLHQVIEYLLVLSMLTVYRIHPDGENEFVVQLLNLVSELLY